MTDRKTTGGRFHKANAVAMDRILVPLADSLGLSSDIRLEKLKRNWQAIVGPVNARNTRPNVLENNVLTVLVSSPAWITQARFLTPQFLKNINAYDSGDGVEVREIRFVLDRSRQE
jgi:predicted nucleic acid-binding Zn ribbon protein